MLVSICLRRSVFKRKSPKKLKETLYLSQPLILVGPGQATLGCFSTCSIYKISGSSTISVREQTRTWSPKVKNVFMSWDPMGITLWHGPLHRSWGRGLVCSCKVTNVRLVTKAFLLSSDSFNCLVFSCPMGHPNKVIGYVSKLLWPQ